MVPAGSRRSKIRPPRKSAAAHDPAKPAFNYEALWLVLADAIAHIQNKNVSKLLYEHLYRLAYTLVLQKAGDRLYNDVALLISSHLRARRGRVLAILDSSLPSTNEEFLRALADEWTDHMQLVKFISDVLMYLNRVYVKEHRKLLISELGVVLFELEFLRYNNNELACLLVHIVNGEITRLRSGPIATRLLLVKMISMLETVSEDRPETQHSVAHPAPRTSLYHEFFEKDLLHRTEVYFSAFADDALASLSGIRFLSDIHHMIRDEEARLQALSPPGAASTLLRSETYPKMIHLMDNVLIKAKVDLVMLFPLEQQGLLYMLEPVFARAINKVDTGIEDPNLRSNTRELRMLYELEGRIDPDRKRLKTRLRETVITQGGKLGEAVLQLVQHQANLAAASGGKARPVSTNSSVFVVKWIDSVLEFQRQLALVVSEAFALDPEIEFTVFNSIKLFINTNKKKAATLNAAELLSVYMDHQIKQFSKPAGAKKPTGDTVSIDETEEFFNKAISFLKLVEDKYAFELHYAAHFAKRFLVSKSNASAMYGGGDFEELVISKLWEKVFMGSHHLERIVKMQKDIKLSAELTQEWKQYAKDKNLATTELELKVCNLSEWPKAMTKDYKDFANTDGRIDFIWPAKLRDTMKSFEEFWLTGKRNDNKALYWYPKFGLMDLRITYPSRMYEINLSTFGGVIMMLFAPQSTDANGDAVLAFEEQRELTYEEIYELTKIPEADLKRQLRSIAVAPRLRLLVKIPMSKDVNPGDKFRLNGKFKSPTTKVKVLTVKLEQPKGQEPEEVEEVQANIDEGRKHLINAAIVRTMKSRQTIKHNDLITDVTKQLQARFLPLIIQIKQQTEDLIEKEYLKRDTDAPNIYHYIA